MLGSFHVPVNSYQRLLSFETMVCPAVVNGPLSLCSLLSVLLFPFSFPPKETETNGQIPGGSEGGEVVTDVIQQLLELSEQVSGETAQPQPPEPTISMEAAINQDILQVSSIGASSESLLDDLNKKTVVPHFTSPHFDLFYVLFFVASSGEQRAECGPATERCHIQRVTEPQL